MTLNKLVMTPECLEQIHGPLQSPLFLKHRKLAKDMGMMQVSGHKIRVLRKKQLDVKISK
jgi:hypothetical protein